MKKLFEILKKPDLYTPSTDQFWDDSYISQNMLAAHLDQSFEAASRNFAFIDQSVQWITQIAPLKTHPKVLDLGCGPGLYADRLNKIGYEVTGVDFSKRSIEYAKTQNAHNTYIYQNYLEIDYETCFDVVLLIFCDYAVLAKEDRIHLLKKIQKALKPGGILIFDVFTLRQYEGVKENTTWEKVIKNGFYKPTTYLCLDAHYIYPGNVHLDQHVIVNEDGKIDVYRIWDTAFTIDTIGEELKQADFLNVDYFSDVSGKPFDEMSKTMCMVAHKHGI